MSQSSIKEEASTTSRTKIFISYNHKDKIWFEQLRVYLKPFEREGLIDVWDDSVIRAGMRWQDEIKKALTTTRVAVLLVSADYIGSDFVANYELPSLIEAASPEELTIIPIIVSPCFYEKTWLQHFPPFNPSSKPLSKMNKHNQAETLNNLVSKIKDALGSSVYNKNASLQRESDNLERSLNIARRNLNILEEQQAMFGPLYLPPHLATQIEDTRKQLADLESRKASLPKYLQSRLTPVNFNVNLEFPSTMRDRVLIVYNRRSREWLERVRIHLRPLEQDLLLEIWEAKDIKTGFKWWQELENTLAATKVIVILVDSDFLASKPVVQNDLTLLLAAAEKDGAKVLPLVTSPSLFDFSTLNQFRAVNDPLKPLSDLEKPEQEEILVQLTVEIVAALEA